MGLLYGLHGLVGLCVGSFLNTVIDRLPEKQSLVRPPSHCPSCGRRLTFLELLPVLGYLLVRGRCRTCGARIPLRVLCVEVASGLLFVFLGHIYGFTPGLVMPTIYVCLMLVIFVIDLERKLVLNAIVLPAIGLALVAILVEWAVTRASSPPGLLRLPADGGGVVLSQAGLSAINHLLGGLAAFLILLLVRVLAPGGMGGGDVKLAAFLGLITGLPGAILAVLGSFVLGGVVALALLLSGLAKRKTPVPFAPFLVVAAFVVMIYGDRLVGWYVGL